jgi:hypothetical protein
MHYTLDSPKEFKTNSLLHFSGFQPTFSFVRQTKFEEASSFLKILWSNTPNIGLFKIGISPSRLLKPSKLTF